MNALTAVVLIALVSAAAGLNCYSCTYGSVGGLETGSNCFGPSVSSSHSTNCTSSQTQCSTICTRTELLGISTVAIVRSCNTGATAGCVSTAGGNICTSVCTTDNCNTTNGSTNVKINLLAMMLALVAGLFFMKL